MMKKIIALLLCFVGLFSCKKSSDKIQNVSVEVLNNRILDDSSIQILDVRTPQEWRDGIIKGALKVDVTSPDFEAQVLKYVDKQKEVYVYCRSGGRSIQASEILVKKGFKPVNVLGGYKDWQLKIEK